MDVCMAAYGGWFAHVSKPRGRPLLNALINLPRYLTLPYSQHARMNIAAFDVSPYDPHVHDRRMFTITSLNLRVGSVVNLGIS